MQTRLVLNESEQIRALKMGIKDTKKYYIDDMIKGDVIFCASAITSGDIIQGVKDLGNKYEVFSFVLHKSAKINKKISNFHSK